MENWFHEFFSWNQFDENNFQSKIDLMIFFVVISNYSYSLWFFLFLRLWKITRTSRRAGCPFSEYTKFKPKQFSFFNVREINILYKYNFTYIYHLLRNKRTKLKRLFEFHFNIYIFLHGNLKFFPLFLLRQCTENA